MALFILRRLIQSLFVLLAVSVVVFFAVYAVGDPIELLVSPEASAEARQAMIARLGLTCRYGSSTATSSGAPCMATWATRSSTASPPSR